MVEYHHGGGSRPILSGCKKTESFSFKTHLRWHQPAEQATIISFFDIAQAYARDREWSQRVRIGLPQLGGDQPARGFYRQVIYRGASDLQYVCTLAEINAGENAQYEAVT